MPGKPANDTGERLVHVRNIEEAERHGSDYDALLTVGPARREVAHFRHRNHRVFPFEDVEHPLHRRSPTRGAVEEAVLWAVDQPGDLLVHCHMGISRSTATAWGVLLRRGEDPEASLRRLLNAHPTEPGGLRRPFEPNRLIVLYLEDILGIPGLLELREHVTREA